MAKQMRTVVTDDLTGEEVPEGQAKTIRFTYNGSEFELDLSEESATKLDDAIQPFIGSARRVGGRTSSASKAKSGGRTDLAAVRAWAADNGHTVSDRGRVPGSVLDAYDEAHK